MFESPLLYDVCTPLDANGCYMCSVKLEPRPRLMPRRPLIYKHKRSAELLRKYRKNWQWTEHNGGGGIRRHAKYRRYAQFVKPMPPCNGRTTVGLADDGGGIHGFQFQGTLTAATTAQPPLDDVFIALLCVGDVSKVDLVPKRTSKSNDTTINIGNVGISKIYTSLLLLLLLLLFKFIVC